MFSVTGCCYSPAKASGAPKVTLTLACAPRAGRRPIPKGACRQIAANVDRFLGPTPSDYPNSTCPSEANRHQMDAWLSLLRASPFVRVIATNPFGTAPFPPPGTPHLTISVRRPHAATRTYTLGCVPPEGTPP